MKKTERLQKRKLFWYGAAAFLMAVGRAGSLKFYEAERVVLSGKMKAALFLIRILLYFVLFSGIFAGIEKLLSSGKLAAALVDKDREASGKWWSGYVIPALFWLPLLIIKYPAAVCWDSWEMLVECLEQSFNEHQSVYYSFIMGRMVELGMKFGHSNWGLFLFSVLHYLLMAAALGYSLQILRKMKISRSVRAAVTVLYILNPYIIAYVGVIIKDIPYTAFLMIVHLCLMDLYIDHEAFSRNKIKMAVLFLAVVNVGLLRKNGSYVTVAAAVCFLIRCVRRKLSKRAAVVMLAAFLASAAIFSFLGAHFNARKGSVREALSLPFQQTARYIRDHGDEVTEEEKEAIDGVLDYETIGEVYIPSISNPVKSTYRGDRTKLPAYFRTWFAQFLKHPMCYVNATWEQFYYLFVPEVDNIVIYQDVNIGYNNGQTIDLREQWFYRELFRQKESVAALQKWIVTFFERLHQMPVIKYLGNVSFWFYVLLIVTAILLACGTGGGLIVGMLYFTMVFVLLGPVIQGHPRYMFPVIYMLPTVALYVVRIETDRRSSDTENSLYRRWSKE